MLNIQIFTQIRTENNIQDQKDTHLFFIKEIAQKTSKKGTNYILLTTENETSQIQKYFMFGIQNSSIKQGDFILAHVSSMGDNWKIDNIVQKIDGSKYTKDLPDCNSCVWKGQAVCSQCQNDSYFQKPEPEEEPIQQQEIVQQPQQESDQSTQSPDFRNEEEMIEVNSVFNQDPQAEEFWKDYDSKPKRVR